MLMCIFPCRLLIHPPVYLCFSRGIYSLSVGEQPRILDSGRRDFSNGIFLLYSPQSVEAFIDLTDFQAIHLLREALLVQWRWAFTIGPLDLYDLTRYSCRNPHPSTF